MKEKKGYFEVMLSFGNLYFALSIWVGAGL